MRCVVHLEVDDTAHVLGVDGEQGFPTISGKRRKRARESVDSDETAKRGKGDEGILSVVQKLGLRAEFMPVALGDWEAEVVLTDNYHVGGGGNTSLR